MSTPNEMPRFGCVLNPLDENPKNPAIYLGCEDSLVLHKEYSATGGMNNSFKNHPIDIDSDGNVVSGFIFRR